MAQNVVYSTMGRPPTGLSYDLNTESCMIMILIGPMNGTECFLQRSGDTSHCSAAVNTELESCMIL